MGVQVSTSRFQWPSVVSGAITRKGPGLPSSCRWNSRVAIDCAVLPRPCARGSLEAGTLTLPLYIKQKVTSVPRAAAGTPAPQLTAPFRLLSMGNPVSVSFKWHQTCQYPGCISQGVQQDLRLLYKYNNFIYYAVLPRLCKEGCLLKCLVILASRHAAD